MPTGIVRATALVVALTLTLLVARATFAQGDRPDSPSASITLPASGTANTAGTAWSVTNKGTGRAGLFAITNTSNSTATLEAQNYSTSTAAIAISAVMPAARAASNSAAVSAVNYGAGFGVLARVSGNGSGVYGTANGPTGRGVYGANKSTSASATGVGVYGEANGGAAFGVYGINLSSSTSYYPVGIYGKSTASAYGMGVQGEGGRYGLYGTGGTYGVYGYSSSNYGVYGSSGYRGVYGSGSNTGVYGSGGSYGVYGYGGTYGVYGDGSSYGVYGTSFYALYGVSSSGYGVAVTSGGHGIDASTTSTAGNMYGGIFHHNVYVYGTVSATGPQLATTVDPRDSSKLIQQAAVVSPQQLGQVNGNVVLDANGKANVSLPGWFGGLYGDLRYQLTPIGDAAVLYVASEAKDGQFAIAGGKPGMKVSWQVSGVRQDKEALDNPLKVEVKASDVVPADLSKNAPAPDARPFTPDTDQPGNK